MAMLAAYINALGNHGASLATHIGLLDAAGTEITGGSYARKPTTWTSAASGLIRPVANLDFDIPAGVTVGSWSAFSALTGGTQYGGGDLTDAAFASAGVYRLLAASTGIQNSAV